jgi:hypothetical protein
MRSFLILGTMCVVSLLTINTSAINLPPGAVTATIGIGTHSFLDVTLSGVPSGYDVRNNAYLGWCVEAYNLNNPGDGNTVHQALLKSTTAGGLPTAFASKPWDKINYVLNNKLGSVQEVQYVIWHYTDGISPDPGSMPNAIAMIQDADANGADFVPGPTDVTAALLVFQGASTNEQGTVIEVPPVTSECSDRFTSGGFVFKDGKKCTFGIQGGIQNGGLWGGVNFIDHGTGMHVRGRTCTSYTVVDRDCRRATYNVTIDGAPGTATVIVCDNGEPGRNDVMHISLSSGYSAGSGTTLGADGSGGGNVQLHKPKCNGGAAASKPSRNARR